MDVIRKRNLLLVYICVLHGCIAMATQQIRKPEIISQFETIIEPNNNHSILCQGDRPLKWTIPEVMNDGQFWTTFITTPEEPVNPSYQYGSKLQIINMTYIFLGFYYCHYKDNVHDNASIYLYINDPDHLTVLKLNDTIKKVTVTEFQEAILPCRPTSPDVQVTLLYNINGSEVPLDVLIQDKSSYRYDPLYGFLTNDTNKYQQTLFECFFKKGNKHQTAFVNLVVERRTSELGEPWIRDSNEGHTVFGQTLVLECVIDTERENDVHFHWTTPSPVNKHRIKLYKERFDNMILETLSIYNTRKSDNGTYFCNVTDNQQHSSYKSLDVKIFDINEHFLIVEKEGGDYSALTSVGESSVQWKVSVKGHPRPTIKWLNNKNGTIPMENGSKYEAYYNSAENRALLIIKNIEVEDYGHYTLLAINRRTEKKIFFLNVTVKPTVILELELLHLINTTSTIKCSTEANPEPKFQWYLKSCLFPTCSYVPINGAISKHEGITFVSEVTLNLTESGFLKCFAGNHIGNSSAIEKFYVTDIINGSGLFDLGNGIDVDTQKKEATVAEGDTITVTCGALRQIYSNITWFFNDKPLADDGEYKLTKISTWYSDKLELQIQHASISDSGLYSCRFTNRNGKYFYQNMTFKVASPEPPKIINTTLQDETEINLPEPLLLYCKVSGIPKPCLTWYKNGEIFSTPRNETKRIHISENNEEIIFLQTIVQDEGIYECKAKNRIGSTMKQQTVKFKNRPESGTQGWILGIIVLLSFLCIGTIIYIIIKIRKEKQLQRELKDLDLANFEKGAVENINPELGIDEQAELLPYDQKWEFPTENLKLGKQLGSGAFGVVMKAIAKNIVEGENETTVAVKMVKKNADNTYIKALASELKIMVHMGKHLNVVNLLGACTKNVVRRELLVIVEFCRFGNLQNYLLRHRHNYIDQIDPETGRIDYTVSVEYFNRSYSVSSDKSSNIQSSLHSPSNNSNQAVISPTNNGTYRIKTNFDPHSETNMTVTSQGEDEVTLSNNSTQPEWRSNYKGDYKGNVKPIGTKDLLTWAFQVASGMAYLASRKVLHGDLAARNILLADNNVIKICDFGLARNMYKDDNYKKRGKCPLPVKWMAIESIRDGLFSTQSDVWSFGVVLWEFFSLARTPYPGMGADERLYQKLVDGYRMEPPQFAPREVYKMMTDCWSPTPGVRPSFEKLVMQLGSLLEDSTKRHYVNLNDPYLMMNIQRLRDGESDYMTMLNSPTFEALSTPHYVNSHDSLEDSDYLSMKSNAMFSPRVEDDSVFDFNVKKRKLLNLKEGNTVELLPMLPRTSDSNCDISFRSPTTSNSISNPSYHIYLKAPEEVQDYNNSDNGMVRCPEN